MAKWRWILEEQKGPENHVNQGTGEVLCIAGLWGRCPGWHESALGLEEGGSEMSRQARGAHLEGSLGPAAEGLLLATQLVALAQLQEPLPTQLFQPCVHRTSKGAEVGVRPGAQPEHTEPGVQGAITGIPLVLPVCPDSLSLSVCLPSLRPPDLRVPSAPALSVLLDSFLFRRQEDTSGSEQETLLKRIL